MYIVTGEQDQNKATLSNQIPADPANVAPPVQNGTTEVLIETTAPLSWNMGLNANSDKMSVIAEVVVKLYEGSYATREEFSESRALPRAYLNGALTVLQIMLRSFPALHSREL